MLNNSDKPPYVIDGEWIIPGEKAEGGWDMQQQSGHVLSPLLAHLVEQVPTLTPMLTTRCVIDLTRGVPLKPLRWHSEIVRQGKKLQVVRAALLDGDLELASITALRARLATTPAVPQPTYPGPENLPKLGGGAGFPVGYDLRALGSARDGSGHCQFWSRLTLSIIDGIPNSPFMHAMSMADFGNGMANALSMAEWNFPNIDIVVMFSRPPEGEWILLDAVTETAGNGLGIVSGILADRQGPFARTHQTLFISPVPKR